jgi:hypothetical protein
MSKRNPLTGNVEPEEKAEEKAEEKEPDRRYPSPDGAFLLFACLGLVFIARRRRA